MKKTVLLFLSLVLFGFFIQKVYGQSIDEKQIKITEFATVSSNSDKNDSQNALVSFDQNKVEQLYIKFDIKDLPKNIKVTKSELILQIQNCEGITAEINTGRVLNSWEKSNINFKNKPGFSSPNYTAELDCINQLAKWDITEFIKGLITEEYQNNGLVIYDSSDPGTADYSRTFDINNENSFLTIRYENVVSEKNYERNDSYTELKNFIRENQNAIFVLILILIIITIITIIFVIFKLLKKKPKTISNVSIKEVLNHMNKENQKNFPDPTSLTEVNSVQSTVLSDNKQPVNLNENQNNDEPESKKQDLKINLVPKK